MLIKCSGKYVKIYFNMKITYFFLILQWWLDLRIKLFLSIYFYVKISESKIDLIVLVLKLHFHGGQLMMLQKLLRFALRWWFLSVNASTGDGHAHQFERTFQNLSV